MGDTVVKWSDLPSELLPTIGKSLGTSIDVLRFRSVCDSWRSSIPPSHTISPRFPLKFPNPYGVSAGGACLHESTLYRLELHTENHNPSMLSSSQGWLVKIQESSYPGKLRLIDPLSNRKIRHPIDVSFPKRWNLWYFRVLEISKAYRLKYANRFSTRIEAQYMNNSSCISGVNKVVLFPNSPWTNMEDCVIFVIYNGGKLGFAKHGDDQLTLVDNERFDYNDIIVYKGHFYVVDRLGRVSWIDVDGSSLKLIQISPPLCGLGQKHLVQSCGALYVVDGDRDYQKVDFKVYKLELDPSPYKLGEELGRWVWVKNLGDRAFILSADCSFTISARDFDGIRGNCIYFTDRSSSHVFNLDNRHTSRLEHFQNNSMWEAEIYVILDNLETLSSSLLLQNLEWRRRLELRCQTDIANN